MSDIESDLSSTILTITLNRPAQRNAMSRDLVAQMIKAVTAASWDEGVSVIILVGAGKGFCAGSDLAGLAAMTPPDRYLVTREQWHF